MRRALGLLLALTASCRSPAADLVPEARADDPRGAGGVAVVELFTSEGCSSCPPANAVLEDLSRAHGPSLFALGFHVDYWNELGWHDRFSTSEATARQRRYASALGASGVYTPQLVVGGTEAFVGSDRAHAEAAVVRALAQPATVRLSLHPRAGEGDVLLVDYEAEGAPPGAVLDVAVVERAATTEVRSGENAGKTLRHVAVVRAFASQPVAGQGTVTVRLPASLGRREGLRRRRLRAAGVGARDARARGGAGRDAGVRGAGLPATITRPYQARARAPRAR